MKTSESIKEIASALSKAQGEMNGAAKGASNPFFKSKYSDLSMVMEAINEPFTNNGLSFVQAAEFDGGMVAVTTRIMHLSGEWVESLTCLPPVKNDAQGFGSAISYAKRYGLQALAGVPSVDDDGNDAVKHNAPPTQTLPEPTVSTMTAINNIEACTTIELLQKTYKEAVKGLDKRQAHFINESTNKRKSELESV